MKKYFYKSAGIFISCLLLFIGVCAGDLMPTPHASANDQHITPEEKESEKSVENEHGNHSHSTTNEEHCADEPPSVSFQNTYTLQKQELESVKYLLPTHLLPSKNNIKNKGSPAEDRAEIVSKNSYQGHIRSVVMRF